MDNPDQDLLRPLSEAPQLQAELERAADLIARLRNYGTVQFRTLMDSQQGSVPTTIGIPLLVALGMLRWGLELLSAIERQIRDGWTGPAKVTIRSLFECMLSSKYALDDPEQRDRRARSYLYCERSKARAFLLSRLPDTEQGKKAATLAARDEFGTALLASLPEAKIREQLAAVEKAMASPLMKDIADEATRLASNKRTNAAWYEYFGGPQSLAQLADKLGYGLSYEVLYRLWSQSAHATTVVSSSVRVGAGSVDVSRLRVPIDLDEVKVSAFAFGRELYKAIGVLLPNDPGPTFALWYIDQRADFQRRVRIVDARSQEEA